MVIRKWAIGLFLVVGVGLFTGILFVIGSRHDLFGAHVEYYTDFKDLSGLPKGADVRVSGLEAGQVKDIDIPANPASKIRLTLQVDAKTRGLIRTDSLASIATEGIVGAKYLSIEEGSSNSPEAAAGATLPSKEPVDLGAVIEKGSALLSNVDGSINDLRGRMDLALSSVTRTVNHVDGLVEVVRPDIVTLAGNARQITGTVNDIVADLSAGQGPAGLILKDEATRQQLQATLSNVQQASLNLKDVSARADGIVADIQSRNLAMKVQASLDNVQQLSQRLNQALTKALAPDDMGVDGAANIREILSNLNRGTTNLADDTEALKHEFFFRGFFKKRGFYDLEKLAPADYLKACGRQKACDSRVWLDATSLFTAGADGQEQLAESGRRQIDSAVAPLVDTLQDHVVIVEGYCAAGSADQQYVKSRGRADLVHEYLETHFHLVGSDVGSVALRDKPPEGVGRKSWNGVAIVVFGDDEN